MLYYTAFFGQGVKFVFQNYSKAIDSSKGSNKLIFIDFYTDWCSPCKKMSKEVFPLNSVGDFFNKHFVNIQVNAEKGEGPELARKFSISEYPTFVFLDHNENLIYRFSGTRDSIRIILEGEKAISLSKKISLLKKYEEQFKAGKYDKALLKDFVLLLSETGCDGGKALNDYILLMSQDECIEPININLFGNITEYSQKVMNKTVVILDSLYKEDSSSATFKKMNRSALKSLSYLIQNSAKKDSIEELEELLDIKKRFSDFGNKDNIVSASIGGGISLLPEAEIRLQYYGIHKMFDKYAPLFEKYISDYISNNDPEKIDAQALAFLAAIDSNFTVKSSENLKEAEQARSIAKTICEINKVQYRYFSTLILNGYENYLKRSSNPEELQKVSEWILYSYLICKDLDIAKYAINKLINLGFSQKANFIIEDITKLNHKTALYKEDEIKALKGIQN